jgi:hypothetical protein
MVTSGICSRRLSSMHHFGGYSAPRPLGLTESPSLLPTSAIHSAHSAAVIKIGSKCIVGPAFVPQRDTT